MPAPTSDDEARGQTDKETEAEEMTAMNISDFHLVEAQRDARYGAARHVPRNLPPRSSLDVLRRRSWRSRRAARTGELTGHASSVVS
jgi:hypothetical protein